MRVTGMLATLRVSDACTAPQDIIKSCKSLDRAHPAVDETELVDEGGRRRHRHREEWRACIGGNRCTITT